MDIEAAIEVFARGFCTVKSLPHPYIPERINDLWVMQDGSGRKSPRVVEICSAVLDPAEVARRVKELEIGWHFLADIRPNEAEAKEAKRVLKSSGYRATSTEWLFYHDLEHVPVFTSDPPVRMLNSKEELDIIPQVGKQQRFVPEWRQFRLWDDKTDYGWVNSVPVGENAWVADLYVRHSSRGKGYGRALMSSLLDADKQNGIKKSVLVASTDGARIYPSLGYQKLGILQLFSPKVRE